MLDPWLRTPDITFMITLSGRCDKLRHHPGMFLELPLEPLVGGRLTDAMQGRTARLPHFRANVSKRLNQGPPWGELPIARIHYFIQGTGRSGQAALGWVGSTQWRLWE